VHLEASTKPHVHRKFQISWTNIASTMACPNFKNRPKTGLCPFGFKVKALQKSPWAQQKGGICDVALQAIVHEGIPKTFPSNLTT
jgi:hypothetical protein